MRLLLRSLPLARCSCACLERCFATLTVLCVVAVLPGLAGLAVWLVSAPGVELELPDYCAARAELAIKLVATSASANFVNIVFSLFCGAGGGFAPMFEENFGLSFER